MRVWIAALLLAAASMSGCRRDNPAWLRATDVGTDSIGGTGSGSEATSGETGEPMSGSDSEGEAPFEDRICLFNFAWPTDLTQFFPGLGLSCGFAVNYYIMRTPEDDIELYDEAGCPGEPSDTSSFHQILIGSLEEGVCYVVEHDTQLNLVKNRCETQYAIVTDPAAPSDPPVLLFSREAEAPSSLVDVGLSVGIERTHVCTCNDSNPNDGLYSPSCCEDQVERLELKFTIGEGDAAAEYLLVPGPESDTSVIIGGKSRRIRVLAAERVAPGVECSAETKAIDEYSVENIAWVID